MLNSQVMPILKNESDVSTIKISLLTVRDKFKAEPVTDGLRLSFVLQTILFFLFLLSAIQTLSECRPFR